jgi:dienelactone hydrolase
MEPEPEPEPTGATDTAEKQKEHVAAASKKGKQLQRWQIRKMVPIQLELDGKDPNVTVEWIDAMFDQFDEDGSNTIDDAEWDNLVEVLRRP